MLRTPTKVCYDSNIFYLSREDLHGRLRLDHNIDGNITNSFDAFEAGVIRLERKLAGGFWQKSRPRPGPSNPTRTAATSSTNTNPGPAIEAPRECAHGVGYLPMTMCLVEEKLKLNHDSNSIFMLL